MVKPTTFIYVIVLQDYRGSITQRRLRLQRLGQLFKYHMERLKDHLRLCRKHMILTQQNHLASWHLVRITKQICLSKRFQHIRNEFMITLSNAEFVITFLPLRGMSS